MTTTTSRRGVDPSAISELQTAYRSLVKAGKDSVRMAWRFGQALDSKADDWTRAELADALDLSVATIYRYTRFYAAYQRPELAVAASDQLETYNIDTLWRLQNDLMPVQHGRPLAGRHFRYVCRHCGHHEVGREEIDENGELVAYEDQPVGEPGGIPAVRFEGGA